MNKHETITVVFLSFDVDTSIIGHDHFRVSVRLLLVAKYGVKDYFNISIGVGRFRILGGGGGARGGGANSKQAHDVLTMSMRRNDIASTSFRRRVPTRFLINQCQIITFLILKYDIIENSRIELRNSFASTFKSN